jgi:hypothetical protein
MFSGLRAKTLFHRFEIFSRTRPAPTIPFCDFSAPMLTTSCPNSYFVSFVFFVVNLLFLPSWLPNRLPLVARLCVPSALSG